jgi:aminodeoxyfutalosine deaminase
MIFRARCVLPIHSPPIENGAILVSGNRIKAVTSWKDLAPFSAGQITDLGDVLLLPGFVNAHCHLDYTGMAGQLPRPKEFPDWIKNMLALKARWTRAEFARSWTDGARMLVESGVTTVANVESFPAILSECRRATPLRVGSFLEMTGVKSRSTPRMILQETLDIIQKLPCNGGFFGLSPHAPYSTLPELLQRTAATARRHDWPVTIHVSESLAEFEMFTERRGPLFDWLESQRDMSDCGAGTPVRHLARNGLLAPNLLAVHVNHIGPQDAKILAETGVSVVHCPRSHAFFGHQPFPLREFTSAGVNVCLGTDSLASVSPNGAEPINLNMFEEMRVLSATMPDLAPETILRMATAHGARALRMDGVIGVLQENAPATFIAIPFQAGPNQASEAVIAFPGPLAASMINGQWAIPPLPQMKAAHE